MPSIPSNRVIRAVELLALFGLLPIFVSWWVPAWFLIPSLWVVAGGAWLALRGISVATPSPTPASNLSTTPVAMDTARAATPANSCAVLRRMLIRFAVGTVIVAVGVGLAMPLRFFEFPRERPVIWFAVMVLYPVLSVYPQELLYRKFFFARYALLFPSATMLALVNAGAFCWVHVIFRNPYALGLTLVGGWFFADTYRRSGSLRLVCLEHALYGCMVFTIGLGEFFFHGVIPTTR